MKAALKAYERNYLQGVVYILTHTLGTNMRWFVCCQNFNVSTCVSSKELGCIKQKQFSKVLFIDIKLDLKCDVCTFLVQDGASVAVVKIKILHYEKTRRIFRSNLFPF